MKKSANIMLLLITILLLLPVMVICNELKADRTELADGWSSIDNVFYKREEDKLLKKPGTGPVKIGFTVNEVKEVLGMPDRIDEENHVFYYHNSSIYFGDDWKVKSWDNRYESIDVAAEKKDIKPGSTIQEVFQERGFPLRIKKEDNGYKIEYINEFVYTDERWLISAIQSKTRTEFGIDRTVMNLEDFLQEFEKYLVN